VLRRAIESASDMQESLAAALCYIGRRDERRQTSYDLGE
jgi:hypothetical protein